MSHLDESIIWQLVQKFNKKYTLTDLSNQFGLYKDQISRLFIKKFGKSGYETWLTESKQYAKNNPSWGSQAEEMFKKDCSIEEIAQKFGCAKRTISTYLYQIFTEEEIKKRKKKLQKQNYPKDRKKWGLQQRICSNCNSPVLSKKTKNALCVKCSQTKYPVACPVCTNFRCKDNKGLTSHFNGEIRKGCTKHKLYRERKQYQESIEDFMNINILNECLSGKFYKCPQCNESFQNLLDLELHIFDRKDEQLYQELLGKIQNERKQLKKNIAKANRAEAARNAHQYRDNYKNSKKVKCPKCFKNDIFISENGDKEKICSKCN